MLCLTVCQPYAALMFTPQAELPRGFVVKHCENRTWETRYRGPLLIHAGKSRKWLLESGWPAEREGELVFGAIVGICWLEDCVPMRRDGLILQCAAAYKKKYLGIGPGLNLEEHPHCLGPVGWMLLAKRGFDQPVTWPGKQGLFDVPQSAVDYQIRKSGFPEKLLQPLREESTRKFSGGPRF